MKKVATLAATLLIGGGTIALIAAVPANADSQDNQYLAALSSHGVSGQPEQLISFAHSMCDVVGGFAAMGPFYGLMASQGLSPVQVGTASLDAVGTYCPEKSNLMLPAQFLRP